MEAKIFEVLKDLTFVNAVIATELIRITENTALMANKPPDKVAKCGIEHQKLNEKIIELVEKYNKPTTIKPLVDHVLKH
ncbi:MAG: hypothetical protein HWN66_19550 [Candidatus Helarchaeota archaeon]|nr:hypothetical protein [Candidatus Helarchaeota archaeon]